jgi:hypothetical protein
LHKTQLFPGKPIERSKHAHIYMDNSDYVVEVHSGVSSINRVVI